MKWHDIIYCMYELFLSPFIHFLLLFLLCLILAGTPKIKEYKKETGIMLISL